MTNQSRIDTVKRYLENNAAPSQVSTEEQLERLLLLGNALGLYDAVDAVRHQMFDRTPKASTPMPTLRERYLRAQSESRGLEDELIERMLPEVRKILNGGGATAASDAWKFALREIPDSVCRVFAADEIREARIKNGESREEAHAAMARDACSR
jgi:hypothetical protein